jgi:hypothetical protein
MQFEVTRIIGSAGCMFACTLLVRATRSDWRRANPNRSTAHFSNNSIHSHFPCKASSSSCIRCRCVQFNGQYSQNASGSVCRECGNDETCFWQLIMLALAGQGRSAWSLRFAWCSLDARLLVESQFRDRCRCGSCGCLCFLCGRLLRGRLFRIALSPWKSGVTHQVHRAIPHIARERTQRCLPCLAPFPPPRWSCSRNSWRRRRHRCRRSREIGQLHGLCASIGRLLCGRLFGFRIGFPCPCRWVIHPF